ncbi:MAG: nuclear transport factor 2 family protein [Flavobacteriaceae bacterium]|nr:nuclear transport factor 2 family protein [Flavobacteriaceae bacterium]
MNKLYLLFFPLLFSSCIVVVGNSEQKAKEKQLYSYFSEKNKVNSFLDQWHQDVANSDFEAYFGKMSTNSIFIGTDASENWTLQQFKDFAKPHFDKKKTWDFKVLERNVYFNSKGDLVWFDELLETWMGVCRGSGVLSNKNGDLKIEHYVLSLVIPNDDVNKVVEIKKSKDSQIIQKLKND